MSPEKQQIAIAELCGYSRQESDSAWFDSPNDEQIYIEDLPDCLNDLNAMAAAERHMEQFQPRLCHDYIQNLRSVIYPKLPSSVGIFRLVSATAAQRAEAFLRSIGKWQE